MTQTAQASLAMACAFFVPFLPCLPPLLAVCLALCAVSCTALLASPPAFLVSVPVPVSASLVSILVSFASSPMKSWTCGHQPLHEAKHGYFAHGHDRLAQAVVPTHVLQRTRYQRRKAGEG